MANGEINIDALMPPQMAAKAEAIGIKKANLDFWTMFALAILAGAFIGAGAHLRHHGMDGRRPALPYGVNRLLGGLVFCLGLILVVVAGAELFTGNNLIVMALGEPERSAPASCCATGASSMLATSSARLITAVIMLLAPAVHVRQGQRRA